MRFFLEVPQDQRIEDNVSLLYSRKIKDNQHFFGFGIYPIFILVYFVLGLIDTDTVRSRPMTYLVV